MKSIKQTLRFQIKEKRLHIPVRLQDYFADHICSQLLQTHVFRTARTIALYQAAFGEVSTAKIFQYAHAHHKACYLPSLQNNHLIFVKCTPHSPMRANRFGIVEPNIDENFVLAPAALDLVIVPLVAFDPQGNRLGMGAGFYDRTFAFKRNKVGKPTLVGIAYDFQCVPHVPHSSSDVRLDEIITEKQRYKVQTA